MDAEAERESGHHRSSWISPADPRLHRSRSRNARQSERVGEALDRSSGGPIGALATLCDPTIRDAAAAAIKAHPTAGTERRVAQALERSAQCIAIREIQSPKLMEWAKR